VCPHSRIAGRVHRDIEDVHRLMTVARDPSRQRGRKLPRR
jgi:hypothetical protein